VADSTVVAIVGVSAGAAVALFAPMITARATTAGQKRRFEHEERIEDRRELRVLLDDALAAIDAAAGKLGELIAVYGSRGLEREAYEPVLRETDAAVGRLERLRARLAIRLGQDHELASEVGAAVGHGRRVINAVNRYLAVPMVTEPPGLGMLGTEAEQLNVVTERFVRSARKLVGARVEPQESVSGS
jgi:hypothetical protein